jgi:hypothetical protein
VRELGEVSISRISCSMPCCNCRAKSSSVRSNSGWTIGLADVVAVEDAGTALETDEAEFGGGAVTLGAAPPESKSSRMSTR